MKKGFIIISLVLLCLVGFATSCKDSSNSNEPPLQEDFTLVGEWIKIGSTENKGSIVVFTKTNVTAFHYAKDYHISIPDLNFDTVLNYEILWYDNAKYLLDDTILEVLEPPINSKPRDLLKTNIVFYAKDTLWIEHFVPSDNAALFPFNFNWIKLYRRE